MELMREIAMAWYEELPQKRKDSLKREFDDMDVNGDGKISRTEFWNAHPEKPISLFNRLDVNGDSKLDFDEFAISTYLQSARLIKITCDGCDRSLSTEKPYFSCLLCLKIKGHRKWDFCSDCHRGGKFAGHEHPAEYMRSTNDLLKDIRFLFTAQDQTSKYVVSSNAHGAIEELGAIAKSYYEAGSAEVKTLADKFFKALDTDNDYKVDLEEFLTFMKREGYVKMRRHSFFHELDKNGDGKLDFWEVMTLYYIIKSGRPFCDECEKFIPGVYFSCLECHLDGVGSSFTLCIICYGCPSARRKHTHKGPAQFLDNYALLKVTKSSAHATTTMVNQHETINHNNTSNSTALIVPAANSRNFSVAKATFLALEAACAFGNFATVASLCTIM